MKNLIYLLPLLLVACSGNEEEVPDSEKPVTLDTSYRVIRLSSQWANDLDKEFDTIVYSESVTDDVYTLKYSIGKDTDTYVLKADENFIPKLISKGLNEKNSSFFYDGKKPFQIGKDIFAVYKFAVLIDSSGCSSDFWNPRLGIFYTKSNKWKTFNIVKMMNDSIRNAAIGKLIMLIEQDSVFANVCPQTKNDSVK